MQIKTEKISPTKAKEYLGKNRLNRPLRPGTVERYARAMEHGEWLDNGEAIKFNGGGHLVRTLYGHPTDHGIRDRLRAAYGMEQAPIREAANG